MKLWNIYYTLCVRFGINEFRERAMSVDNSFTLAGGNERLRRMYPPDRNEPFFLAAVTLLAADDNARRVCSFSSPISAAAGEKGSKQPVFYRDNLRRWRVFRILPDAKLHASSILYDEWSSKSWRFFKSTEYALSRWLWDTCRIDVSREIFHRYYSIQIYLYLAINCQ